MQKLRADLSATLGGKDLLDRLEAGIRGELFTNSAPAPAASPEPAVAAQEETFAPTAEEAATLMAAITDQHLPEPVAAPAEPSAPPSDTFGPLRESRAPAATAAAPASVADNSIRVSLTRLETLLNFVGEMVILQTVLREQAYQSNPALLRRTVHQLGKVTKEVQDISMSLRMVPVKQTFQKMQRIVRDTANVLGKKVNLHFEGEETEIDKTVLDAVADPLVHMVRNAVDHGIESAERRQTAGKGEEGNIYLRAFHQAGKLVIEVADDGGGIDGEVLVKKAVEKGIIPAGKTLSARDSVNLIFHPGFSTKQVVTDVSGRGVGMDVVKTNIESLQGEVLIETQVGKGSTFRVQLPLTLAIIDGMVVRSGEERFVMPLSQVFECVKPEREWVTHNVGLGETLILRAETIPLVRLGYTLGRPSLRPAWESIAIVVRSSTQPFAILVDDIIGQHQVVVKKLGGELQRLRAFSGSAVLGDGRPALIIEPGEIAGMVKRISKTDLEKMERAAA